MPDPQWETLKNVFHAALALPPEERGTFLDQAARGNAELRRAVESLLQSHQQTSHFVDTPAYQAAAELLVDDADFQPDQLVGHYRILSLLGEGGMGTVYLAEDTKLHRRVALKFLSRNLTQDDEQLLRFEHEARAASALNHPNILIIHEIGESEDHRFIATEFIEGETLRKRLANNLDVNEALQIAIQIASALVAAHRVGVVHRDIKPENIMIRSEDGLVKVLDFGLAKTSTALEFFKKETGKKPPSVFQTGAGMVLGTVAYMSPEQARGETVDARTDNWNLGVVFYEMLTGSSPFIADTPNEIIAAILSKEAVPLLSRHLRDVPPLLEKIVAKALSKNQDERYQTSQDFLLDLRELQRSMQSGAGVELHELLEPTKQRLGERETDSDITSNRTGSSAKFIANQFNVHRRSAFTAAAMILFVLLIGVAAYLWRAKHIAAAAAAPQIKSLAVLPLKSLDKDHDYLGVGIADTVISRVSQTGQLTVKPTSAVLKFSKDDTDSLAVARQLKVDAVLEGNVQRAGDRLRISVNLLRVSDGNSLWTENFDLAANDVFAMQDKVADEVAKRLQLRLDSNHAAKNFNQYPTNPIAYEYYIKGVFSLDQRGYDVDGLPQMQTTIDFLKKAIDLDPNYALAHAQLAFAYVWTAVFVEPTNSKWADLAREEIDRSQQLNPELAETHFAKGLMYWTAYEGYQNEAAIRELLIAKQINPNSVHPDLPAIYQHVGLDDLAARELKRALEIDPTSQSLIDLTRIFTYLQGKPDEWLAVNQKLESNDAPLPVWYLMRKGRLDEAQKRFDSLLPKGRNYPDFMIQIEVFQSLKGNFSTLDKNIPGLIAKISINDQSRHHATYDAACAYALAGRSAEAVRWLKETANTGFPNYPLFERDHFLDRIRKDPEFIQFMVEQKVNWEKRYSEFSK